MISLNSIGEHAMSATALPANPSRRRPRATSETSRSQDALNPSRGIMVGFGLSALIWTGIGALLLG